VRKDEMFLDMSKKMRCSYMEVSRFPAIKEKRNFTQVETFKETGASDKVFFKKQFFRNISKTVLDIKKMYIIKFVDL